MRLTLAAALTAVLGMAVPIARTPASWPITITPLASPAAAVSGQPQLSVSERGVLLSWIEQVGTKATLKFSEQASSERAASGWSAPRVVASGSDWFVNWADVPSVVRLADGTLAGHWLRKHTSTSHTYDVNLAFSRDNGATWSAPTSPHHDGTKSEHGFASLFQIPGAGLGLIRLDGRATRGAHAHGAGNTALRFAAYDAAGRQTAETQVDARVCDCCATATAMTDEGIIAVYRDRSPVETRDIFVTRLEKGTWTAPVAVHADNWTMGACPVNGPAIAASGGTVAVAWFTAKDDQPHAFVARSADGGRSFGPPVRLDDTSSMGRVDVEILPDESIAASYIELQGKRATFRIRRIDRDGAPSAPIDVATIEATRASGSPRLARAGNDLVLAWIERGRVRTAIAALP